MCTPPERTWEKIFTGLYYLFDACTLVVKRDLISVAVNSYWFDSGRGIFLQVCYIIFLHFSVKNFLGMLIITFH